MLFPHYNLLIQNSAFDQMNKQKIIPIIKNAISLVNNFDPSIPLERQCQSHGVLDSLKITQKQFNILPPLNKKAIGIRNIFENSNLRLTVYYLQKDNVMKLHDHNEMHVISAVLSGKIEAKLYKLLNKNQSTYQKIVNIFDHNSVLFIDGNKTFNLHQFKALEPTFFIDIIFPDYNQDNDCNFYQEKNDSKSQNQVKLEKVNYDQIIFQDI